MSSVLKKFDSRHSQSDISIASSILALLTITTNRHRDRQTTLRVTFLISYYSLCCRADNPITMDCGVIHKPQHSCIYHSGTSCWHTAICASEMDTLNNSCDVPCPKFQPVHDNMGGSVAEWLACWTQAQKGLGSNRRRDAVR